MFGLLCQCEFDAVMRQPLRIGPVTPAPSLEATPVEQQGNVTKKATLEDATTRVDHQRATAARCPAHCVHADVQSMAYEDGRVQE